MPVAAVPPLFCAGFGRVTAAVKTAENPLNLTKSKRFRIGFKANVNYDECYCTGLFSSIFADFPPANKTSSFVEG